MLPKVGAVFSSPVPVLQHMVYYGSFHGSSGLGPRKFRSDTDESRGCQHVPQVPLTQTHFAYFPFPPHLPCNINTAITKRHHWPLTLTGPLLAPCLSLTSAKTAGRAADVASMVYLFPATGQNKSQQHISERTLRLW